MNLSPLRAYVWTWIALLVLLALTAGSSLIPLGRLNLVLNLGVAAVKAALVLLVFMRVRRSGPMVGIVALAGLAWLCILAGLSAADFATRG